MQAQGEHALTKSVLTIWTIYDHPTDYPNAWVARAHDVPGGPTDRVEVADSLEALRAKLPRGLTMLARHPDDDPVIREVWL